MNKVRVIKKYSNRKFYDTLTSEYVTLNDIALLIKDGEEIFIYNNSNKQEITRETLLSVLCNTHTNISNKTLANIIKGATYE